ncbi:MAG: DNA-binding response OmpR family regulator [Candidatus Omnitrophota bacterium]|jgi:DNA-binding response OmpR family regulator
MAKKILVVDDEEAIVMMVSSRLNNEGYETVSASDGESAVKAAQTEAPDLIICDVMMPPPNGFQVCRIVKDDPKTKHIPIILLTAKATESDKFWGSESGADTYVTKPYNPEELLQKVKELLETE